LWLALWEQNNSSSIFSFTRRWGGLPDRGARDALQEDLPQEGVDLSHLHEAPSPSSRNGGSSPAPLSLSSLSGPRERRSHRSIRCWPYALRQTSTTLLSFHSGFLNATTFLSSRSLYMLHMTGNVTVLVIELGHHRFSDSAIRSGLQVRYLLQGSSVSSLPCCIPCATPSSSQSAWRSSWRSE
jgi:hypothetical protein